MIWFFAVFVSALLASICSQTSNPNHKSTSVSEIPFEDILESFQEVLSLRSALDKKIRRPNAIDMDDFSSNRNFDLDFETQRLEQEVTIFEHIATATNMYDLSEEKRNELIEKLNEIPKFREIVRKCKKVLPAPQCDSSSLYRTLDGSCNNLKHPRWGSLFSCHERLLPANYKGVSGIADAANGEPLPHPRTLSLHFSDDIKLPRVKISQMFPFFGQLLAHDIVRTPPSTSGGRTLDCCLLDKLQHPQCISLTYSSDDPYYSKFNFTCQNIIRHIPCPTCSFEKRKLINQVTSFIDCSFLYGINEWESNKLRELDGTGKLRTQRGNLMPQISPTSRDLNCVSGYKHYCFQSGDSRGNQHLMLASLQNLFVREHNRIATEMKVLNPHWDEETIYQETRRPINAFGRDIQAINIYRGRDHGVQPYIKLLAYCSNNKINITTFEDLNQVMEPENIELLKQNYKDVVDIDLIVGLQMEYNSDSSVVPPTAACINAIQFKFLKDGDRFFFTHTGLPTSYSKEKIEAIYNASLSRLICDNTKVKEMQMSALLTPSDENPVVPCSSLPEIDLYLWKSEPEHHE
ncbi:peroxidasin-like isoform X3 [Stegodyphus dumicola]|uniref:peroxidasin-like isoform X3 n=1 Tax=Stegodyphus dumicola TaxID=202533 RepID=UPI0015ACEB8B|nr:peroxidasin-like isoform X3 [Stegodyphus dumicola]